MKTMYELFKEGDRLYGYCNGAFGRNDYEDKVCTLVRPFYALFEYDDGRAVVLNIEECNGLTEQAIKKWKEQKDYDE